VARFFAVDPAGEALNVNALDEVPDSSWFTNRIGRRPLDMAELARGPCTTPPPDPAAEWTITQAKPNGANPGFIIRANDGKKYLLKFDGLDQGPRATAADVIGSLFYHAAGYFAPCNRIVYFDARNLRLDPKAESEDAQGGDIPMTRAHIDLVLNKGQRLADGRYRASASLFLEGKPLGPWTYSGTRCDDPNDVIPHEDRRELRGMRLLAAWIHHFDSREMNTLGSFIETGSGGYVRHNMVDFGDSFGSLWEPPMLGRRLGHAYYLDFEQVLGDLFSLGLVERPWEDKRYGASGPVFAYFDVDSFEPHKWKPGYPNPAFMRMSDRDGAWMARIIARFSGATLATLVAQGKLLDPLLERELVRILEGRRDKILRRYLSLLSPLSDPVLQPAAGFSWLCLHDLAVSAGLAVPAFRRYTARATSDGQPQALAVKAEQARVCSVLPSVAGASAASPKYLIVDVAAVTAKSPYPTRVHLYQLGAGNYRIVGLERPDSPHPPAD
jgi:hypothetical protein